ncbi:MAG: serine protease [Myxococcota bacterium]
MNSLLLLSSLAFSQNIVGGQPADDGDWPDVAALFYGDAMGCTGVLIAPSVVLTAGHCDYGRLTHVRLNSVDYTVEGEQIAVQSVTAYPDYLTSFDLAVIVLAEPARTPFRVIAQDCILDRHLEDGAPATIAGYGATDNYGRDFGTHLNVADITIDDAACTDLAAGCLPDISPGGEVGAGAKEDADTCQGDSGGPLILNTEDGDFLLGITSRGYAGAWPPCGPGGIYARPDAVIGWIEETAGVTLARPDCGVRIGSGRVWGDLQAIVTDDGGDSGEMDVNVDSDEPRSEPPGGCSAISSIGLRAWIFGMLFIGTRRRHSGV